MEGVIGALRDTFMRLATIAITMHKERRDSRKYFSPLGLTPTNGERALPLIAQDPHILRGKRSPSLATMTKLTKG